ncbi:MAG: hypothetical protein HYV60_10025 [Planctomycetia bacterium]|nr:hypothetical protein [Planctomycetia bacterium]
MAAHQTLVRCLALAVTCLNAAILPAADQADHIHIYDNNPRYWQYQGQPVLLLGGSKTGHIFLAEDLKEHLDEIAAVGANYVRTTMSQRYVRNTMSQREGVELKPHKRLPSGKFDLEQWNDDYWQRFADCLRWCRERDIIMQIEVWDRFDFSTMHWEISPWRPQNNINYDGQQTGLAAAYPAHPSQDRQPFFHTIPGMDRYDGAKSDLIRKHQERFVEKMLAESLKYPNVLYCMNNETSTDPKWGHYWMTFIRGRAEQKGITVYCTDMFDDVWKPKQSEKLRRAFDDPRMYPFLDVSQVNSRTFNEDQWNNIFWIAQQREAHPRPLNHTKIYSDGQKSFGTGTPVDGVERFWRNLIAGSASVRFHRPDSGIGLNDTAKACIRAARKAESLIPLWAVRTAMEVLGEREADEAYLAALLGEKYLLYFTDGGSVTLDLTAHSRTFDLRWIDVSTGDWGATTTVKGGSKVIVSAPGKSGWVATLIRQ